MKKAARKSSHRPRVPPDVTRDAAPDGSNGDDTIFQSPLMPPALVGYVDFYGYCSAAGGWLFGGWVSRPPITDHAEAADFQVQFERRQAASPATLAYYQRGNLNAFAIPAGRHFREVL